MVSILQAIVAELSLQKASLVSLTTFDLYGQCLFLIMHYMMYDYFTTCSHAQLFCPIITMHGA